MTRRPEVSVLLLTRDGMGTLPELLDALEGQERAPSFEVVAVDSGSTDGTLELLERRAGRLLRVEPSTFDHGLTRNLGIAACEGELVALLVQDARPADGRWLAELTAPFRADQRLAGAYARQLPRPEAGPVTRRFRERWPTFDEAPRTAELASPAGLEALPPLERLRLCTFDNVSSCLRKRVWEERPFAAASVAEDLEWGRAVLLSGYRLRYVPGASVLHSHERSLWYELSRSYLVNKRLYELFGVNCVPSLARLGGAVGAAFLQHLPAVGAPSDLLRAAGLSVALPLGQYLGARAAASGRDSLRPARV